MAKLISKNIIQLVITAVVIISTALLLFSLYRSNNITIMYKNVPLRTQASPIAKEVQLLKKGTEMQIVDRKDGWYKLRSNDDKVEGWAASWLLDGKNTNTDTSNLLRETTIFLDAGHGGKDPGSLSNEDSKDPKDFEKTYTLKYIQELGKKLEKQGARVFYTRTDDTYVPFQNVPDLAKQNGANIVVSIHFDSSEKANDSSGVTQYFANDSNGSKDLASFISEQMGSIGLDNRGTRQEKFTAITSPTIPSTLLEMGYINNEDDFKKITEQEYQDKVVNAIYKGLINYLDNNGKK